jgi:hypothetical protein
MKNEAGEEITEITCDGVQIAMTPFDLTLWIMRRPATLPPAPLPQAHPGSQAVPTNVSPVTVGIVRMSLEQAKAFAIVLRKNLKSFEDQTGLIPMHPAMLNAFGISKSEDWW